MNDKSSVQPATSMVSLSRLHLATALVLLAVSATGIWAVFSVENERKNLELRQIEALHHAALAGEGLSAWRYATGLGTFAGPLANSHQEPKRSDTFRDRKVWVKTFQRGDIKPAGTSQTYGNVAYLVTTIISLNDKASEELFKAMLDQHVPSNELRVAAEGEWHNLTMHCRVERLDSGEWIASGFTFSPIGNRPDFPFERVIDK
jgi:hypothetical protein